MSSLQSIPSINPISVDVVTLDSLLPDMPTVDLIKIDVEGHELQVLRGAADLISQHRPLVIFEFIQSSVGPNGNDFQQFDQYFRQFVGAKYEIRGIEQTRDGCVSLGPYKPGVHNYAAIPELKKQSLLSNDFAIKAGPSALPQYFPNA